jgi:hypothetical protein
MVKLLGTEDGRILMCGNDGCVYELLYQAASGWFSKKCRKLNHSSSVMSSLLPSFLFGGGADPVVDILVDSSRTPRLLFTLSGQGTVQAYALGGLSDLVLQSTFATERLLDELRRNHGVDTKRDASQFKVVALAVVPEMESSQVSLASLMTDLFPLAFLPRDHFRLAPFLLPFSTSLLFSAINLILHVSSSLRSSWWLPPQSDTASSSPWVVGAPSRVVLDSSSSACARRAWSRPLIEGRCRSGPRPDNA